MEIKKLDEDKCKNLKDLFIEWHERHEEDVNELRIEVNKLKEREYSCPSPRKLTKLLKEFGIPGCFSEWFIKDVDMGNVPKAENWVPSAEMLHHIHLQLPIHLPYAIRYH